MEMAKLNEILPTKADLKALYNVCQHSELVTNVCSSTVLILYYTINPVFITITNSLS
jgi:hypothetical protein